MTTNVAKVHGGFVPTHQKFDSSGDFLTKWGSQGTGEGRFSYSIAVSWCSSTSWLCSPIMSKSCRSIVDPNRSSEPLDGL